MVHGVPRLLGYKSGASPTGFPTPDLGQHIIYCLLKAPGQYSTLLSEGFKDRNKLISCTSAVCQPKLNCSATQKPTMAANTAAAAISKQ